MIEQLPEFIGRENELKLIEKLVKDWNILRVFCIHGPGGIGKTRLLLEVYKRYTLAENLLVVPIFDFFDPSLHIRQNIGIEMTNRLGKDKFETYLIALEDLRKMELAGIRREKIIEENQKVDSEFTSCYNKNIASTKRVVLMLDTLEAFQDNDLWYDYLLKKIKNFNNTLILMAGRRLDEIFASLTNIFGKDCIEFITLSPFTTVETETYFEKSKIGAEIDSTTREKIHYLTDGRPILIDLAIDLLGRELPLPEIAEKTVEQLKALNRDELHQLTESFEKALVKNILNLTEPIHKAILLMAVVRRSFDAKILSFLNDIPIEDSKRILKELKMLSFVRLRPSEAIILHDEMRRMVNEYVWPFYDALKTQLKETQKKAAQYYNNIIQTSEDEINEANLKINELKYLTEKERIEKEITLRNFVSTIQREIWFLRIEYLYHTLRADLKQGLKLFTEAADLATERFRYDFRDALFREALVFLDQYTEEDKYEIYIREARYLLDEGKYEEGYEKVKELLNKYSDGREREVDMLVQISNNVYRIGRTKEAIAHLEKALKICEIQNLEKWTGRIYNEIGWLYRRMGSWERAAEYYYRSLDHAKKLKDFIRIADTLNNLGFVFGLQGDYGSAIAYCKQALEIRKEQNIPKDIGMSYNTLAMVYRSKGDYDTSLEYSEMAASIFEEQNDLAWLTRVYRERGVTYWFQSELEKAKAELVRSKDISERYGFKTEFSNTYHRLGHVIWELGLKEIDRDVEKAKEHFKEAEQLFIDSYHIGEEVADIYMTINSLAGIIELYYDLKRYTNIDRLAEIAPYYQKLKDYESHPEYNYPLYYGSAERILGAIAQENGDYDTALKHYKKGYPQIAMLEGYSRYILDNRALGFLEYKIKDLPPEIAINWCDELVTVWKEKELDRKYPEFISTCEMLKMSANFKLRKE